MVQAYGQTMPLNQVASITVPEPRDPLGPGLGQGHGVNAVDKAIRDANLGLSARWSRGRLLRIRIPELNEQRRKRDGQATPTNTPRRGGSRSGMSGATGSTG